MDGLSGFENSILDKLLHGDHPILSSLRLQAEKAQLHSRRATGAGFFCTFLVPENVPPFKEPLNFQFGDVIAKIDGLRNDAGFVVFVRNGYLDMLEGYSYDEPWPAIIEDFELIYQNEPRSPNLPDRWVLPPEMPKNFVA